MRELIIASLMLLMLYGCTQGEPGTKTVDQTTDTSENVQADAPASDSEAVYAQMNSGDTMDEIDEFYYSEIDVEDINGDMEFELDETGLQ